MAKPSYDFLMYVYIRLGLFQHRLNSGYLIYGFNNGDAVCDIPTLLYCTV